MFVIMLLELFEHWEVFWTQPSVTVWIHFMYCKCLSSNI